MNGTAFILGRNLIYVSVDMSSVSTDRPDGCYIVIVTMGCEMNGHLQMLYLT
jgi:hypothetical protein